MPISQINPDGSVKIYNKETGQVLDVPPEDLPKYSGALVGDYQKLKTQQDGVRNAAKAVQAGQIKISDVPAEQKMGVINQITAGGGKIPEPVNAADQKKKSSAGPALNLIKNLESQYQSAGGGQVDVPILSRIVGAAKDIGGNLGFDDSANRYNATREGFAASLKQLTGDTGVLTDQDYARLSKLLPSLGAKPEEAKAAFNLLRSQLGSTLNQPATQTTINPQKKTLGDLAAPFVKPLADYGKFIGGAEYEGVRAAASALGDKNAYNEQIHTNPFLNHQDLARYQNPAEGLKTTAGAAAYAIPYGKGANLLTKAILPGAAGGALRGIGEENATPESVVGNAAMGAAGGVGLNALSKVPGVAGAVKKAVTPGAAGAERGALLDAAEQAGKTIPGENIAQKFVDWGTTAVKGNPGKEKQIEKVVSSVIDNYSGKPLTPTEAFKIWLDSNNGYKGDGTVKTALESKVDVTMREALRPELEKIAPGFDKATKAIKNGIDRKKFIQRVGTGIATGIPTAVAINLAMQHVGGNR